MFCLYVVHNKHTHPTPPSAALSLFPPGPRDKAANQAVCRKNPTVALPLWVLGSLPPEAAVMREEGGVIPALRTKWRFGFPVSLTAVTRASQAHLSCG